MLRTVFAGTVVVLEGQTDTKFYDSFLKEDAAQSLPVGGKEVVIGVVAQCRARNIPGVLGIVDADFWHLEGIDPPQDIVPTDQHDLEMLLLMSRPFARLTKEMCSATKVEKVLAKEGCGSLIEFILQCCKVIGVMRLVNERFGLNLSFAIEWHKTKAVDKTSLVVDLGGAAQRLLQSNDYPITTEEFLNYVVPLFDKAFSLPQLCCGHDAVQLMSVGLRGLLGSRQAKEVEPDHLVEILRMVFQHSDLRKTTLFRRVRTWEAVNPPFRVFSDS